MKMDNENSSYRTKDLAEASVLITLKQQLLEIERTGSICWFVFENSQLCKEISNKYFFGEVLVNAREFHEILIRLKNRIFAR